MIQWPPGSDQVGEESHCSVGETRYINRKANTKQPLMHVEPVATINSRAGGVKLGYSG